MPMGAMMLTEDDKDGADGEFMALQECIWALWTNDAALMESSASFQPPLIFVCGRLGCERLGCDSLNKCRLCADCPCCVVWFSSHLGSHLVHSCEPLLQYRTLGVCSGYAL